MPRYDDHLGLVNPNAKEADCMHYCQGSLGWYEHLRNTVTVIVQAVEADRDDRPTAKRIELGGSTAVRACNAAVAALDATVASGILTLVIAMLGYTSPVTGSILLVCCARRWHHRRRHRTCEADRRLATSLAVESHDSA